MKKPSGRFVIRMSGALHARLKREAMSTGQSLNQVCISRLRANKNIVAELGVRTAEPKLVFPDFLKAAMQRWPEELIGMILFGSAARGDATEDSDIDLLLVMNREVKIARDLYRLWDDFCRERFGAQEHGNISPHFVNLPESVQEAGGLWYETAIDGIVLWESDRKVSGFLASVRAAMGQGKIRRRMLHGSPYWIKEF